MVFIHKQTYDERKEFITYMMEILEQEVKDFLEIMVDLNV